MARLAKELSPLAVSRLKDVGAHAVGGVAGLYLRVKDTGARSWTLRVMVGSERREIGLGSYPTVTLAEAREIARAHRKDVTEGIDPLEKKRAALEALKKEQDKPTFSECVDKYLKQFLALKMLPLGNVETRPNFGRYRPMRIGFQLNHHFCSTTTPALRGGFLFSI